MKYAILSFLAIAFTATLIGLLSKGSAQYSRTSPKRIEMANNKSSNMTGAELQYVINAIKAAE